MSDTLILVKSPPYQGRSSHETLEAIMALALFDIEHRVAFIAAGAAWLLANHQPGQTQSLAKQLQALSLYGADQLYVCQDHLQRFKRQPTLLTIAEPVTERTIAAWIKQAKQVEVF